ncbi:6547_t:CDS:1 [Scutellospora calospora]|uniref:6547_t:CDS:1 n=1 Tax=Scutellospora calospora TaxID=85575 RepID=A0ACA9ND54_9GLOM|nr:6547_t:CDS:1 [Scutellospora calospora]
MMDNGVFVESIKVVNEIDDIINLEGKILINKFAHERKNVTVDYSNDLWNTYFNVDAKKSHSISSKQDLYIFELTTFKRPGVPLYLEFSIKCDVAGSVFWTNGYQYIYDEGISPKEFFFNKIQLPNPSDERKEECIICMEYFDPDDLIKLTDQCIHDDCMCRECIRKHIETEISDKGNFKISCPKDDCIVILQGQDVKKFVDDEIFSRYVDLNMLCVGLKLASN